MGSIPIGGAIRCLGSSIGRTVDFRRLVSKENTSNGGGCAIHPAASIIYGLWFKSRLRYYFSLKTYNV